MWIATRIRIMSFVAVVALVVVTLASPLTADWTNTAYYSFSGCDWKAAGGNLGLGFTPYSRTVDRNGGCRYIDADVKYREIGQIAVYTKWCPSLNAPGTTCSISSKAHDNSRSRAQSWETDHWQSSGWWL